GLIPGGGEGVGGQVRALLVRASRDVGHRQDGGKAAAGPVGGVDDRVGEDHLHALLGLDEVEVPPFGEVAVVPSVGEGGEMIRVVLPGYGRDAAVRQRPCRET